MATQADGPNLWDVFVSHNGKDKVWVRHFVRQLRSLSLRVFFAEDDIRPGANFLRALSMALQTSRYIVLVLSPSSLSSDWVALEYSIAVVSDPSARERR